MKFFPNNSNNRDSENLESVWSNDCNIKQFKLNYIAAIVGVITYIFGSLSYSYFVGHTFEMNLLFARAFPLLPIIVFGYLQFKKISVATTYSYVIWISLFLSTALTASVFTKSDIVLKANILVNIPVIIVPALIFLWHPLHTVICCAFGLVVNIVLAVVFNIERIDLYIFYWFLIFPITLGVILISYWKYFFAKKIFTANFQLRQSKLIAEENERINRTLLQALPFPIDITDCDGNIVFQNSNFDKSLSDFAVGQKCWDIYNKPHKQCENCKFKGEFKAGMTWVVENSLNEKTYEVFHIAMVFKNKNSVMKIFIDITERKNNELLIQNQNIKLRELNSTKDRFISILAHDLKNPFASLIGFSELLATKIDTFDMSKIKRYVSNIYDTSKETYSFLEELLEWARIQQESKVFNVVPFKLKDTADGTISVLIDAANLKGISVKNTISEEIIIQADLDMIKTILRNLVTNSIKFTNHGGSIEVSALENSGFVTVSVKDTGIGIDNITLNTLFKINEMKSQPGTSGERGSGFGLLLCKEFVEMHGGKIWVESVVNAGSEFKFSIPVSK